MCVGALSKATCNACNFNWFLFTPGQAQPTQPFVMTLGLLSILWGRQPHRQPTPQCQKPQSHTVACELAPTRSRKAPNELAAELVHAHGTALEDQTSGCEPIWHQRCITANLSSSGPRVRTPVVDTAAGVATPAGLYKQARGDPGPDSQRWNASSRHCSRGGQPHRGALTIWRSPGSTWLVTGR